MKRIISGLLICLILLGLSACVNDNGGENISLDTETASTDELETVTEETDAAESVTEKGATEATDIEQNNAGDTIETMKITMDGTTYEVALDQNETVTDLVSHLPLELEIERYADHEYYAELPFTPVFDEERTSQIKAGHVYYWDGWNAFVINYIDWDIAPYQVVHIGEITDSSVSAYLTEAEDQVNITVEK